MILNAVVFISFEGMNMLADSIIQCDEAKGNLLIEKTCNSYTELDAILMNLVAMFDITKLNLVVNEIMFDAFPHLDKLKFSKYVTDINATKMNGIDMEIMKNNLVGAARISSINITKVAPQRIEAEIPKEETVIKPLEIRTNWTIGISQEQIEEMRNLKGNGVPAKDIISKFNLECTPKALLSLIWRYEQRILQNDAEEVFNLSPFKGKEKEEVIQMSDLYAAGTPLTEIATRFKVKAHPTSLHHALLRVATYQGKGRD